MKQIGRYEIRKEAGRGGMATVYEAFDPHFRRAVAIKVMTRDLLANATLEARFRREAQIIAGLEHPAIVPVYDFGEEEMRPYLVMRLMTGGTLADRLQGGPLSVAETAQILSRIGSALERAHEAGVIHRDLKPSNIMFDQYGDAFLADFGIARLTEGAVTLTGENVIGTPAYMSPEQIQGDQTVDGRSDIYALGVICFEMLTGRRPYQETTPVRLMMQHLMDPVPDIREVRPDLPPGIEAIISNSMAKSPDERYAHAAELADTLDSLASISPATPAAGPAAKSGAASAGAAAAALDGGGESVQEEIEGIERTVPDSAELRAQQASAAAVQVTPPSAGAGGEAAPAGKGGRRKWILAGVAAAALLLVAILAAVFLGDFFSPAGDETRETAASGAEAALIEEETGDNAQPETAAEARNPAEPDLRPTVELFLDRFYVSMDAEDFPAAEEAINQAIAVTPDDPALHGEKAWLMETVGNYDIALAELAEAMKLDPENGEYHARRGNIFRELGNLDGALANHLQAVEINPGDPYLHMELAETYKRLENPGMALEQSNQALALKDDEAWFYESRADIYFQLGDYELGLADLARSSELDPEQRNYFSRAGDIFLYELDNPQQALEFYSQAVEHAPDDSQAYADRAGAFAALENKDAALADLNRAIELDPQNGAFYIERARIFLYVFEDQDAALGDLNRAVELDPGNPEAFAERAALYQDYTGNLDAALEDRSRALELEPDGPWRYADLAQLLRAMGREQEALAHLQRCLEVDPGYYWCVWDRAWILDALGKKQEAADNFQRFLEQSPKDECPECRVDAERYIRENR